MSLEVVVLGSSGTYPGPGRACSSYLLRTDSARVLVDCGNGSSANLLRHHDVVDLDAIVVTHAHPDHFADLVGMYYALRFHATGQRRVDVFAPPGLEARITGLLADDGAATFRDVCPVRDVSPGDVLAFGALSLHLHHSRHSIATVSVRAEHDGATFVYSSDSAGGPELVAAARDADLFLCEATWLGQQEEWPDDVHLTASQAGIIAREAGVARLALTHLWPANDREQARAQAQATFVGPVELAEDGQVWMLS